MPDMLTPQALAAAGPLLLETFFKHFLSHQKILKSSAARGEDIMYDEAFVLMKTFLEIATNHPVSDLQRFGLVRTPAPPPVALHRVIIPEHTLRSAADYLVTAFGGEEMAYKVAGGSKWWQVRAGPGVEAEWIVMKKDWKEYEKSRRDASGGAKRAKSQKRSASASRGGSGAVTPKLVSEEAGTAQDTGFRQEMDELRCMLYIHGGAYYWGSINTHRYTIWRHARKMHGRCFAVNYRKAPQYPFPCAIQDCLAAYLYLVNPPPGAKHTPVSPKNIVLAGDSAGGGLTLALLQILRDTPGLELPAGAVLISPWSDLTHSFPSILHNTATDIVPPYSFIHKPSSLWPPPPPALTHEIQSGLRSKVKEVVSRVRGKHSHHEPYSSTSEAADRVSHLPTDADEEPPTIDKQTTIPESLQNSGSTDSSTPTSRDPTAAFLSDHPEPQTEPHHEPSRANPALAFKGLIPRSQADASEIRRTTLAQSDVPLELTVKGEQVKIDTQIQLIATNGQLCHPWLSPVLGYLGGLPPLFICAGDNEVLRDEIIYLAHKAANPKDHPIRDDVRAMCPSLNGIEEKYEPTDVHLQVYDGTCHDLPLFSMTRPARGLFRAIATFARFVTPSAHSSTSSVHVSGTASMRNSVIGLTSSFYSGRKGPNRASEASSPLLSTTSSLRTSPAQSPLPSPLELQDSPDHLASAGKQAAQSIEVSLLTSHHDSPTDVVASPLPITPASSTGPSAAHSMHKVTFGEDVTDRMRLSKAESSSSAQPESRHHNVHGDPARGFSTWGNEVSGDDAGPRFWQDVSEIDSKAKPGEAGHASIYGGPNPFTDHMIRERVSTHGVCRPLEPPEQLAAMTMPSSEIGTVKEGPAMRYLNGQALWDKKFARKRKQVAKQRERNLKESRNKDAKKIGKMWRERVEARKRAGRENGAKRHGSGTPPISTASSTGANTPASGGDRTGDHSEISDADSVASWNSDEASRRMMTEDWSWKWALDGEAPPPSAIVSRRDFSEARQLALEADRMDHETSSPVHGLSIWVALASFFSSSSDRDKAHEAVKSAAAEQAKRKKSSPILGASHHHSEESATPRHYSAVLFKTPTDPIEADPYHVALTSGLHRSNPIFVQVLQEKFVLAGLKEILRAGPDGWAGVVITSKRGAEAWVRAAREVGETVTDWSATPLYTVGPTSIDALQGASQTGLPSTLLPRLRDVTTAKSASVLVPLMLDQPDSGRPYLLIRGDKSLHEIPDGLRAAGRSAAELVVYETTENPGLAARVAETSQTLAESSSDTWLAFFSPSSAKMALAHIRQQSTCHQTGHTLEWAGRKAKIFAIGETTRKYLEEDEGLSVDAVAVEPTPAGLVQALKDAEAHDTPDEFPSTPLSPEQREYPEPDGKKHASRKKLSDFFTHRQSWSGTAK